jgi:hypothetical protein
MTTSLTPSDVLNRAADLLEKEEELKWGIGEFFGSPSLTDERCEVCGHGAIGYAALPEVRKAVKNGLFGKAIALFCEAEGMPNSVLCMAAVRARKVGLTYSFNDNIARSKEDVIAKLRQAANITD